jgi:hypothetical protein
VKTFHTNAHEYEIGKKGTQHMFYECIVVELLKTYPVATFPGFVRRVTASEDSFEDKKPLV